MAESEAELVAGFHTEYSGMKFGLFFLAEYVNMTTVSALTVALFFGGWQFLPFFSWADAGIDIEKYFFIPSVWFLAKIVFFLVFFVWVRWTIPRFRYDQLMRLGWKTLIPVGLVNLVIAAAWVVAKG